jgi:hypothetical protein
MREDGAELMKEDRRRRRTVGSWIEWDDYWIGKASEGSQWNSGSFWCGSGGEVSIFLFWTEKDLAQKVGEKGGGEWTVSFVGVRGNRSGS